MTLFGIAWRNIRQRALTSCLTALSLALGVALVVATLVTAGIVKQAFNSGAGLGYSKATTISKVHSGLSPSSA